MEKLWDTCGQTILPPTAHLSLVLLAKGAEDLLTGFWRELVEKIDDLLGNFLFEPCGISGSSDFGMRKTHVSGNVARIVELTANLAFYGSWHLDKSKKKLTIPIPRNRTHGRERRLRTALLYLAERYSL